MRVHSVIYTKVIDTVLRIASFVEEGSVSLCEREKEIQTASVVC